MEEEGRREGRRGQSYRREEGTELKGNWRGSRGREDGGSDKNRA